MNPWDLFAKATAAWDAHRAEDFIDLLSDEAVVRSPYLDNADGEVTGRTNVRAAFETIWSASRRCKLIDVLSNGRSHFALIADGIGRVVWQVSVSEDGKIDAINIAYSIGAADPAERLSA